MKVKEILELLPSNQETQVHYGDYGYNASYPQGLINGGSLLNEEVRRVHTCKNDCTPTGTVVMICTNKMHEQQ